jgi:hypothetical protein
MNDCVCEVCKVRKVHKEDQKTLKSRRGVLKVLNFWAFPIFRAILVDEEASAYSKWKRAWPWRV